MQLNTCLNLYATQAKCRLRLIKRANEKMALSRKQLLEFVGMQSKLPVVVKLCSMKDAGYLQLTYDLHQ